MYTCADVGLTRYVKITGSSSAVLQVSELAAWTAANVNVALNKPCTASPAQDATNSVCSKAFDGTYSPQVFPNIYHSSVFDAFMQVDLGANFKIDRVDYYNRDQCCPERIIGAKVELLDSNNAVLARMFITTNALSTSLKFSIASPAVVCDHAFEGGNWALVRRVKQGSTWHPATDDLMGTDVYGTYGTATSDSTFSVAFSAWITPTTELLFISGKCRSCAIASVLD